MSTKVVPHRQIPLEFAPSTVSDDEPRKFRDSLSALELADDGRTLFLGVDETVNATPTIERLSLSGPGYAAHEALPVEDFLALPDGAPKKGRVGEIDIEGLAVNDSFLWVVGSHSAARKKPKRRPPEEAIERLATVKLEPNRMLLGRIPLALGPGGATLAKHDGARRSARLVEDLREVLCDDPLLAPFVRTYKDKAGERLTIPGKDNGFDIEGIIVQPGSYGSSRILLGLRGPVLRGWATILELELTEGDKPNQLVLRKLSPSDELRYRRHLLHMEGLGIRDLRADGDDVLILAGPTMTLDGQVALYRWIDGLAPSTGNTVTELEPGRLEHVLTLPSGHGEDRPEGFMFLPSGELVVVYDSPADARLIGEHGVLADVFTVPGR